MIQEYIRNSILRIIMLFNNLEQAEKLKTNQYITEGILMSLSKSQTLKFCHAKFIFERDTFGL